MLDILKRRTRERSSRQKAASHRDRVSLVSSFYRHILGREPDEEGLENLLTAFSGPDWVGQVLNAILESEERRLNARHDAIRAMVGSRPGTIVSLGSSCHMASILSSAGWRTASYPFDWIFSDFSAVIDMLDNDFRDFLDTEFYVPNPHTTGVDRVAHRKYGMHPPMFQHHDVHLAEGHAYLQRCVERLRGIRSEAVVFAASFHADRFNADLCGKTAEALERYFGPQATLLGFAVEHEEKSSLPRLSQHWQRERHRIYTFRPVSKWQHTQFDDPIDDVALLRTIRASC